MELGVSCDLIGNVKNIKEVLRSPSPQAGTQNAGKIGMTNAQ